MFRINDHIIGGFKAYIIAEIELITKVQFTNAEN